ncbi:hypothetical protein [Paraburkholderia adhaesiva]|uniref:hypothetical protein n=1 Tax=Paraburkholderia adhaesiva TaxID=2883244 RepID=UPI001F28AD85|nr:hypothetical protein [Paraburkholderia adhaesiva]
MRLTDSPPPVTVPFAQNGNRNTIPVASQTGMTKGAASFNDGFPPLTMTDPLKGGIPPFGVDMNGILFVLSQAVRWLMAGGPLVYSATFANDPNIGGYPAGVVLLRANGQGLWLNLRDDNTTDPDAADITNDGSASGWVLLNADWNATGGPAQILNRPNLAKVATSGQYGDLTGTPSAPVNADWDATSGLAQILHRPNLATVATTGRYGDLTDVPEIPAAQVNADWDAAGGPAQILNRPDLATVATTGSYADLTGEPVFTTPPQFDVSTAAATSAFVQRALGSYAGQVTYGEDTGLDATDAGMAIQWAGPDGGTLTLAPTATLPLSAIAFLVYNHGLGVLNLVAQGSDFIWMGGPTAVAEVVLQPGEFAVCLARVNGEYDVLVTRIPVDYTLPAATATTLGGVIAGPGTTIAPARRASRSTSRRLRRVRPKSSLTCRSPRARTPRSRSPMRRPRAPSPNSCWSSRTVRVRRSPGPRRSDGRRASRRRSLGRQARSTLSSCTPRTAVRRTAVSWQHKISEPSRAPAADGKRQRAALSGCGAGR